MTRPMNVLLITADQWRGDCLSSAGHPAVRTPHLDALAADGVLFRNHFAQCAPCGPSRASLLTGMYMMNHRSVRNGTPLDARFTNIALEARKLGYDPALIGYTDTSLDPRYRDRNDPALATYAGTLPGFLQLIPGSEGSEAWLRHLAERGYDLTAETVYEPAGGPVAADRPGAGPTFAPARYSAEDSDTAFDVDGAIRHLGHRREPWFLHLSLLRPHPPYIAPAPYHAMYDPARVPGFRGAASPEEEARLHPYVAYMLRHFHERDSLDPARHPAAEPAMRQLRATYYGLMTEVDANIGRLLAFLKRTGRYDATLIVFTTDHGEQLWDHWMLGKEFFFDQSFHLPLIVRAPGLDAGRGRTVDHFTESIDVMPTILDLLGAEPPLQCDGASLRPFLAGGIPAGWRQAVHWELDFRDVVKAGPERELGIALDECSLAVVRDHRHKYVHFTALPSLLFDIAGDPDERHDLAGSPDHRGDVARLAQAMLSWRLAKADRTLAGIRLTSAGPVERARHLRFGAQPA